MWKFVAPKYEVSTAGEVKSYWSDPPKILKPQVVPNGYLRVDLYIGGKPKHFYIHRLVAEAFIPNPDNKPCVNHLNGVKTDNRVENLEWVTDAENKRHAFDTGLAPQGGDRPDAKLTNEQARYIRDNPDSLNTYELADKFSVNHTTVSRIQLGKGYRNTSGTVRGCKNPPPVPNAVRDEIRRLYVKGDRKFGSRALARQFGVNHQTILNIVREVSGDV